MPTLNDRLRALERATADQSMLLPLVVPDDTSDDELQRLRQQGRQVFRASDPELVNAFV